MTTEIYEERQTEANRIKREQEMKNIISNIKCNPTSQRESFVGSGIGK